MNVTDATDLDEDETGVGYRAHWKRVRMKGGKGQIILRHLGCFSFGVFFYRFFCCNY